MSPGLNLKDAPTSSERATRPTLTRAGALRPILTRQLASRSEARRVMFGPSASSTQSVPENEEVEFSLSEAKQEVHVDEESRSAQEEYETRRRLRTFSGGSLVTVDDDDTITTPTFENTPTDAQETSESIHYLFGYALPRFPSGNEIASFIVKYAPCFWCRRERHLNMTSRSLSLHLILLNAFFGLVQAASASYLVVVLFSNKLVNRNAENVDLGTDYTINTPNLWSINGNIMLAGLFGTIAFFLMICSRRVIREVNLVGSLRFMWCMLWIVPLEIYVTISMFDYHRVTEVWIKHYWSTRSMAWFREWFCYPGTYNTLCVVPVKGLPVFETEGDWCKFYYPDSNEAACQNIRDAAQTQMAIYAYTYFNVNGAVGVIFVILLSLTVHLVEGIITKPIVQKSRERNIPLWLVLPIAGCLTTGALLLFSPSSVLNYDIGETQSWPGVVYLISGGLYFFAALLGWFISTFSILNARDKRTKHLAILLFISALSFTLLSVGATFVFCILISVDAVEQNLDEQSRGQIACSISAATCSFCDNNEGDPECPEWSDQDVSRVVKTTLKQLATLAAIFLLYSIGALRFGFVLRKHLSLYQIDYV